MREAVKENSEVNVVYLPADGGGGGSGPSRHHYRGEGAAGEADGGESVGAALAVQVCREDLNVRMAPEVQVWGGQGGCMGGTTANARKR